MAVSSTAAQAETAIKGSTAGSFVPRRHNVAAEGQSGKKDWWFCRKAYGHWLVFSSGAYTSGKKAEKDPVIDTCSQDFLYYVIDALDKRRSDLFQRPAAHRGRRSSDDRPRCRSFRLQQLPLASGSRKDLRLA